MDLPALKTMIHLTHNQKLIFERFIKEISSLECMPAAKLLESPALKTIIENHKLNKIQKGENILKILYELRYPELTRFNKKFKELHADFKPNPYFEDTRVSIGLKDNLDYEIRINTAKK